MGYLDKIKSWFSKSRKEFGDQEKEEQDGGGRKDSHRFVGANWSFGDLPPHEDPFKKKPNNNNSSCEEE